MTTANKVDVLLVGGGVMSATLASLLSELDDSLSMLMVERLPNVAAESTDAWNNAGTGHAGYCELNYTPLSADGNINISRALAINASFEVSLQFWAYLIEKGKLPTSRNFINQTPHLSFVWGDEDVAFLRKRYDLLKAHHLFQDMEFSEDIATLEAWMPLIMQNRDKSQRVAATRMKYGSDVDFGALTKSLVGDLQNKKNYNLALNTEVKSLKQHANGRWHVRLADVKTKKNRTIDAGFVFLGAGGGALKLLQKSGVPESHGYGGFPVSGQWLVCNNPEVIQRHHSKVYGKAALGAPPMSVPHLDTRMINGKPALLFGPYAGFTTKFLKQGSYLDLFNSVKPKNLKSIFGAGRHNMDLTRYLIGEATQKHHSRVSTLRQFYPQAVDADWHLEDAGKRVQIIKNCDEKGGKLEFGTEIVAAQDGSIAALLGASPGASVAVQAMIDVLERCFNQQMKSEAWQHKLKQLIPSYGESLVENAELLKQIRQRTLKTLNLT
ncbi:malate dehydrogenase (quinone) [Methylotenera sp.]|uniref:malate dehydrogenase (quinone) n=1 Tax=Methylotenera sp. TaxID=2051956 RepID=UPI00271CD786|nr:malate dehydrogenase (quinone) [Methylotenera sp.]MDO9204608.1 malate dehydrogenase (quinone) [Methylotenera sp.]